MTEPEKETRINLIKRWLRADIFYMYADDYKVYQQKRDEYTELQDDCAATGNRDLNQLPKDNHAEFIRLLKGELIRLGVTDGIPG